MARSPGGVWISPATETTARVYERLCEQVAITGNLVPDAELAALAVEHGVELASADTDFGAVSRTSLDEPVERVVAGRIPPR